MQVFIDTNAIIRENFLRSVGARTLFKLSKIQNFHVLVPEIVLDETKGQYSRRLTKNIAEYNKATKSISQLVEIDVPSIDIATAEECYRRWLCKFLRTHDAIILPYPQINLSDIVKESYRDRKPFKDNGDGYKDYILWKTICDYINAQPEPIDTYFITNNTKDFCKEEGGQIKLHPDLSAQIDAEDREIMVCSDVGQFVSEHVLPILKVKSRELLSTPELSDTDVRNAVEERLISDLHFYTTYGFEGLSFSNEVTISAIHEFEIQDQSITRLDNGNTLINVVGTVEVEVDGFISKSEFYQGEHKDVHVIDPDWNEWVVAVSQTIDTPFRLAMSYDKKSRSAGWSALELRDEVSAPDYK